MSNNIIIVCEKLTYVEADIAAGQPRESWKMQYCQIESLIYSILCFYISLRPSEGPFSPMVLPQTFSYHLCAKLFKFIDPKILGWGCAYLVCGICNCMAMPSVRGPMACILGRAYSTYTGRWNEISQNFVARSRKFAKFSWELGAELLQVGRT
jgi:hypothetical protein